MTTTNDTSTKPAGSVKRTVEQAPAKRPRKPCPDLPKGVRCPLCGGEFVCLQSWRKKSLNTN